MLTRRNTLASLSGGALALLGGEAVAKPQVKRIRGVVRYTGPGVMPVGYVLVEARDWRRNHGDVLANTSAPVSGHGAKEVEFSIAVPAHALHAGRDVRLVATFVGKGPYMGDSDSVHLEPRQGRVALLIGRLERRSFPPQRNAP